MSLTARCAGEHHGKRALASPDHYLFLPRVEDREAAIWLMDRYFGKITDATGLRTLVITGALDLGSERFDHGLGVVLDHVEQDQGGTMR